MHLVDEGVEMSADTNARIENILIMIQTLQNGATNVIKAIENQKSCNDDILREFATTQQMFQKLNTTIMNHIHDAEKVDVQLTKSLEETAVSHNKNPLYCYKGFLLFRIFISSQYSSVSLL